MFFGKVVQLTPVDSEVVKFPWAFHFSAALAIRSFLGGRLGD